MQLPNPTDHDLVLIGGGHSHALVLRRMGMQPWPTNVRLTLITNLADTPYSGMLPCHIAGLYDFDTAHIDLRPLTRFANCQLVMDKMVGLDAEKQQIICQNHPPIAYDTLSIDIGSTPTKSHVPGAAKYATPAKPVPNLLKAWSQYLNGLETTLQEHPQTPATIGIVGGGVGGVEMAFAMQVRLWALMRNYAQAPEQQVIVHIFQRGAHLAKGRNRWTQRMVEGMCKARNIQVHTGENVCEVTADAVRCDSGLEVKCDRTFWVTNAAAPPWLQETDLSLTQDGFIAVKDTLQTRSHPNIFAAGDVATMVNYKRPKAGVFAVRQGPPLYENLKRHVTGYSPKPFRPQSRYLNIIDTDTQTAIASWGPFAIHAKWCRTWKDSIDRKFMSLFSDFPQMDSQSPNLAASPEMHCAGCGSKVGSLTLTRALNRIRAERPNDADWPHRDNIYTGLDEPDDAAIIQVPAGKLAVHSVDQFTAIVDDPFIFGQICANHCLSDLFAMGATSHSVLSLAILPYGSSQHQEETLYQLLSGLMHTLNESKTFLVGGHTTEGPTLSLGLACNGWLDPNQTWKKSGLVPGQSLILTKAVGTGTLFAADQQLQAKGRWIEAAIASMRQSNRLAANCLRRHGATACTDVTGFGLAGHLLEMAKASQTQVDLDIGAIDHLPGALSTLENRLISSLHQRNQDNALPSIHLGRTPSHLPSFQILFDPQTAGGLLASVPAAQTRDCLSDLHRLGYAYSRRIGTVTTKPPARGHSDRPKPLTITRW
ncbi:MAG: selenide, water dikinase SelD [Cyanobacteria bacterium J06607_13]